MSIRTKAAPNLVGQPSVNLDLNSFEASIWNKGYNVIIESAVECPCKANNGNISSCENCRGSGWVFINPFETRALITSINYDTQYKDWGLEKLGTVNVSVRGSDRISYFDRVSMKDDYSVFSEVLRLRYDDATDTLFAFTSYKINSIETAFLYEADDQPLIRLSDTDIEIKADNDYVLIVNYDISTIANFNNKLSIRYRHNIQYNVIDMPHEIRRSYKVGKDGKDEKIILPVNAVARRVHQIESFANVADFDGNGIIDNTYL